ncbi:methionine ABC transporter ATP-binding protein [Paenibacillus roseipurpureus]|uniref:ATP-binding cassette domain-containing protein n=1 Tax=Paenibacillus roseopurpureus TaxID=2918901 RepID=A0AA96LT43_9BACL|nr:ATP-binding cassette domain-containing protein [Paenibacillus sp. MBLB1832]WNR46799.1 ATP-binding cassette domain-containing protein [Paenibacillus sp. MBLB1832]
MIHLHNVSKTYITDKTTLQAVSPTSLEVSKGDIYGLIGFSGAGKSTLLRLINRLEQPTTGTIYVNGQDLTSLSPKELREARHSIGMIFQHFNLLSNQTCLQNVEFALEVAGIPSTERKKRAAECLDIVGLSNKAHEYPARLSGGQKQRVAIARSLANNPKVLLCDEPTSSLDPHTTLSILKFLERINREMNVTIVIVTHEINVVKYICNKVAVMENGSIIERLDLSNGDVQPYTSLGKFLFETAGGWTKEMVTYE